MRTHGSNEFNRSLFGRKYNVRISSRPNSHNSCVGYAYDGFTVILVGLTDSAPIQVFYFVTESIIYRAMHLEADKIRTRPLCFFPLGGMELSPL
jgi:hypothetical protein